MPQVAIATIPKTMIRVLLFEDNKSFRETLQLYFKSSQKVFITAAFPNAQQAVKLVREYQPDIVLMDIQMPGISGLEALQQIKVTSPDTKVMMLTTFKDEHHIFVALCWGASGYILKGAGGKPIGKSIERAIRDVHNGGGHLSPIIAAKVGSIFNDKLVREQPTYVSLTTREQEVLKLLCEGNSYQMIADACKPPIAYNTVCDHMKNIYKKLEVNSAPEAIRKAWNLYLVKQ